MQARPDAAGPNRSRPPDPLAMGVRIRSIRLRHGFGVRELARRTGVSPGLLSQIEHGTASPSVSTLFRLAEALSTSTDSFFHDSVDQTAPVGLLRGGDRDRIRLDGGIVWERVTAAEEPDFELLEVTYPPGAAQARDMQTHPGRDSLLVVEGVLQVFIGNGSHILQPGDSLTFDSGLPHRLFNPGFTPTRLLALLIKRGRRPPLGESRPPNGV